MENVDIFNGLLDYFSPTVTYIFGPFCNFVVIWYIFPPFWYISPKTNWQPWSSYCFYQYIFLPGYAVVRQLFDQPVLHHHQILPLRSHRSDQVPVQPLRHQVPILYFMKIHFREKVFGQMFILVCMYVCMNICMYVNRCSQQRAWSEHGHVCMMNKISPDLQKKLNSQKWTHCFLWH
jgi:hypothetical protein